MMYGYPNGVGLGAAFAMMFFGLIVLVAIILLIVWAVRAGEHRHPGQYPHHGAMPPEAGQQQWQPTQPGMMAPGQGGAGGQTSAHGRDPAADAARERYARGEITKEQLDEIMKNLGY
jgi:uncharacterized membrane protein